MIRFFRRRLILILTLVFIVISGELVLANTTQKNQELIHPPIKITEAFKNIPHNPDTARDREDIDQGKQVPNITSKPSRIRHNPNGTKEDEINEFAWKDFVALNWPVNCKGDDLLYEDPLSGEKPKKIIGQAPEAPRAWELYPSPKDVFLPNGAKPTSLDKVPEDEKCLGDGKGAEIEYKQNLRLTETGELVGSQGFNEAETASRKDLLDGYGELKEGISLVDIDAANHIPLVDWQGNYVINEIRMNPVEFKQISDNHWFNATELVKLIDTNQLQLVCSNGKTSKPNKYCNEYKDEGAIEIKAVWRVFDGRNTEQEKARYYITQRQIVSNTGEVLNEKAELGLIGFHIMHKTSHQGWIWSTFEHIDNAPSCNKQEKEELPYTLYNNECKTGNCEVNKPYVKQPYLWHISNEEPKAVTSAVSEGTAVITGMAIKDQVPSQICRTNSISTSATKQNKRWQESLRTISQSSVWQYYQLIGTQWIQNPELPYSHMTGERRQITPAKLPLTNVALEPYAQGVSCIVCHTSARLPGKGNFCQLMLKEGEEYKVKACADFSFLMDNAQFSEQPSAQQN